MIVRYHLCVSDIACIGNDGWLLFGLVGVIVSLQVICFIIIGAVVFRLGTNNRASR